MLMDDVVAATGAIRLFIYNDDDTPVEFVRSLLHEVFGKSEREAIALTAEVEEHDRVACGPYPAPVAKALMESVQQLIRAGSHPLVVTSESVRAHDGCDLCSTPQRTTAFMVMGRTAYLCSECLMVARQASEQVPSEEFRLAYVALDW